MNDVGLVLKLPAEPQELAGVRAAVGDHARGFGADDRAVEDLRTVVSEACSNVILHAYPDGAQRRPLEVLLRKVEEDLHLVVRDEGRGLVPDPGPKPLGMRVGLALVGALSSCFQPAKQTGSRHRARSADAAPRSLGLSAAAQRLPGRSGFGLLQMGKQVRPGGAVPRSRPDGRGTISAPPLSIKKLTQPRSSS